MKGIDRRIKLVMSKPTLMKDCFDNEYYHADIRQQGGKGMKHVAEITNESLAFVVLLGNYICAAPEVLNSINTHMQLRLSPNTDTNDLNGLSSKFDQEMKLVHNKLICGS